MPHKRPEFLSIGADDIDGHYAVDVMLRPELPQDRAARVAMALQISQMFMLARKQPPLKWLLTHVLEYENADEILELAEEATYEESPEIQQIKRGEYIEEWLKDWKPSGASALERMLRKLMAILSPEQAQALGMLLLTTAGPAQEPSTAVPEGGTEGEVVGGVRPDQFAGERKQGQFYQPPIEEELDQPAKIARAAAGQFPIPPGMTGG